MISKTKRLVALLLAALVLTLGACTPSESIPGTGDEQTPAAGATATESTPPAGTPAASPETPGAGLSLAGTSWTLESFGEPGAETPVLEGTDVTLEFAEDGQAGGSGGCNSFGAIYEVQGHTLSFSELTSTLMACTDEGVGEQEQQYTVALQSAGEFELTEERLIIRYNDGQGVLNFTRLAGGGTPEAGTPEAGTQAAEPTSPAGQNTPTPAP